jgi:DNA-binding ferritin-like protein
MSATRDERLYSILKGYEKDLVTASDRLAFLAQDLSYVLKELKDHIESEYDSNFKEIEDQIDGVDCDIID